MVQKVTEKGEEKRPVDVVKEPRLPSKLPHFPGEYRWLIVVGLILFILWAVGASSALKVD